MCGRFALTVNPQAMSQLFGIVDEPAFPPREAIAPTEPIGVVVEQHGARRFVLMRWGFLPSWCKDPASFPLIFNARAETLAEKPAFRAALRRRRCLVPADGFYEWQRGGEGRKAVKTPWLATRRDGRVAGLAGLWETYHAPDGSEIDTALIITTAANAVVGPIHDRMPVVIEPEDFETWLDVSREDSAEALALLRPAAEAVLVMAPCDPARPRPLKRHRAVRPKDTPPQGTLF